MPMSKRSSPKQEKKLEELSLDTIITENQRFSQIVRAFFKSVILKFHFAMYIQNYFKENVGNYTGMLLMNGTRKKKEHKGSFGL